jgi:hypothetical protein
MEKWIKRENTQTCGSCHSLKMYWPLWVLSTATRTTLSVRLSLFLQEVEWKPYASPWHSTWYMLVTHKMYVKWPERYMHEINLCYNPLPKLNIWMYSWCTISIVSTATDSFNSTLYIVRKKCICPEHVQIFILVVTPWAILYNNIYIALYVVLAIVSSSRDDLNNIGGFKDTGDLMSIYRFWHL